MENTKIKFWGCGRLGTIGMAVLLSFALRAEDLSASPGSDANVTIDSIAAGTVTNFTTASMSDKWNCIAKRSNLSSTSLANDYVTATVVRNADGTATVGIEVLYSFGAQVVVGVYKGSETSGSGTLVKTITFKELAAEERTRTIAVGETLNESCTFYTARNWACDITQSGTVVAASVNTASAISTALTIEGKAEGAATVTVSRTQNGSSKTAMYVYHVTVTAGEPPEPPEPPSEDEQPTDLSPATTAENPIALLTETQTNYLYTMTFDGRRSAAQGGQYAELFCYGSPVVLSWKETTGSCAVSVKRLFDNKVVWTGETAGTSVTVHNLELGAGYEWTVTSKTSGLSASATFYTSDLSPRLIQAGRMKNLRDLGGWTGLQGCKVRQNLLFRGAAADVPTPTEYLLDGDADREFFYNVVGLKNEVDLRNISSTSDVASSSKQSGKYKFDPTGEHVTYNNFSIANNALPTNGEIVKVWKLLMTPAKLPAYFHCKSGRDRTGIVAAVLLAALGVSRDDIVRDFQTTSDKDNWTTYGFNTILDTSLAKYKDANLSLADNAKAYLMDCGFSAGEVEDFREALLEGYVRQVGEPARFCVTPYLQHPSSDAMTILFFTDRACAATVTCGGQTTNTVGVWAPALTNNVNAGDSSVWNNKLFRHRVRFEGLKANASYDYTVTLADGATYSDTFRTAPDRNTPIRFVSYADCETTKDPFSNYVKNLERMKGRTPDFITVSGDLVARGGLQQNWDGFWKANAGTSGTIAGSIPVLTVIGNHDLFDNGLPGHGASSYYYDMQGEPSTERFLSYFEVESNGVDFAHAPAPHTETRDLSQLFHRVDYGPVTLIFLDSNNGQDGDTDADHDKDTNYLKSGSSLTSDHLVGGLDRRKGCRHPDFNVGSPQYVWLTNNLAEAQAKSRFTFVLSHHCPYSRGAHNKSWTTGEDGSALALRFLTETFVRYGVDGWYCGHDELLEHSVTNGIEVLPDGTKRPHTLSVYDLGCSGDTPRNSNVCTNPLEYWWSSGNYGGSGSYGFLETDVAMDAQGRWTCTVTPIEGATGNAVTNNGVSTQIVYVENPDRAEDEDDFVRDKQESIPLPTTTEADASFSNVPMGTVKKVTTTSRADTWECAIESADKDERSICMEASVERNADGTATVSVNCKYANGTTFTVDIVAVTFAGERKTVKKIKVNKIAAAPAVEIPLTVGGTFTVDCPFGAAEPWKLSKSASGSIVEAQLSSGANESVATTKLSVTARAAGTETVTVIRVNGQYSTDMYVYTFVVKESPTPFDCLCAAAAAGEAYVFEDDMEFPTDGVLTVPAGTSFVLDLRGHAVVAHANGAIVNHGTLTILDSTKASPLQAHLTYTATETGKGYALIKSDGELVVDGAFVDAGFVNGADSEFGGGNTAVVATGGRVTVKNGAHVGGQTAIEAAGDARVEVYDSHAAGRRVYGDATSSSRGVAVSLSSGSSSLSVSNSTLEAEGFIVSASRGEAAASTVTIVDSVLATSRTTAPFELARGSSATVEKTIYVDRMAKWFPVTTALANDGANLKVGAGCLLAVANEGVIGFLDEGVTAAQVASRVWRTKGADEEALPSLTPEEEAKIAEVLSSSPDALLKASVTTIEDYTAYKAWVDAGVASGAIESEAAAKGAAGSFFSFATDQNRVVDPGEIDEEKVKVEEMKVNGGEVTLTVGIEDLPVGENAQKKYLEQVFGVTGTGSLEKNDFAAEKVVYKQDMVRNADGTVSYTVEPKVEEGAARPDEFYFKAKVSK